MKKLALFLSLLLTYSLACAQRTLYSSGDGSGDWNDARSWSLSEDDYAPAATAPGQEDHLVIRHTTTLWLEGSYVHRGNIHITKTGVLEIMGGGAEAALFAFAGSQLQLEGTLVSAGDFVLNQAPGEEMPVLAAGEAALVMIFGSLSLVQGRADFQNVSCGASEIQGQVVFRGPEGLLSGPGKLICQGVQVWDDNGRLMAGPADETLATAAARMEAGSALFLDAGSCVAAEALVAGARKARQAEPAAESLEIFPNPAINSPITFRLRNLPPNSEVQLTLRNLLGQTMLQAAPQTDAEGVLSFQTESALEAGVYFAVALSGKQTYTATLEAR
jgi:hypothetical protein